MPSSRPVLHTAPCFLEDAARRLLVFFTRKKWLPHSDPTVFHASRAVVVPQSVLLEALSSASLATLFDPLSEIKGRDDDAPRRGPERRGPRDYWKGMT